MGVYFKTDLQQKGTIKALVVNDVYKPIEQITIKFRPNNAGKNRIRPAPLFTCVFRAWAAIHRGGGGAGGDGKP